MPTKLAPQWWSPVMPISFFLSSIAAGTALVILVEMWIAKAWNRQLRITQLAAMGKITFWSLLVYLVFRLGDMAHSEASSEAHFLEDWVRFLQLSSSWAAFFLWRYWPSHGSEQSRPCFSSGHSSLCWAWFSTA